MPRRSGTRVSRSVAWMIRQGWRPLRQICFRRWKTFLVDPPVCSSSFTWAGLCFALPAISARQNHLFFTAERKPGHIAGPYWILRDMFHFVLLCTLKMT